MQSSLGLKLNLPNGNMVRVSESAGVPVAKFRGLADKGGRKGATCDERQIELKLRWR